MKKDLIIYIVIGILIVLIVGIALASFNKEYSFDIQDTCGPIMNLISHTVKDKTVCTTKCMFRCESKDLEFKKVEFYENMFGCNNCTCYCQKSIFT